MAARESKSSSSSASNKYSIVVDWKSRDTERFDVESYHGGDVKLTLMLVDGATVIVPWASVNKVRIEER